MLKNMLTLLAGLKNKGLEIKTDSIFDAAGNMGKEYEKSK